MSKLGLALSGGGIRGMAHLGVLQYLTELGIKPSVISGTSAGALVGAFLGLLLTGNPIGFTAFMGIISLIGIVVRNGIILVDYADELVLEHGYTVKAAAKASGKRRMRPIFLTSAAAAILK